MSLRKILRFYYWLIVEFLKKHIKVIIISVLLSFIFILSLISLKPYISSLIFTERRVIGIVGNYDLNQLPNEILLKISNPLVFVNEKGDIVPALASSWEEVNGGKEYRFHLRKNLLWADGKPFTAYDIKYKFKDVKEKVIDQNTIHFYLGKPLKIFPSYLIKPIIRYPLIGVGGIYKVGKIKSKSGYVREILLIPNKKGIPFLVYKFYENENSLINAYKLGLIKEMTMDKKSVADSFGNWPNTEVKKIVDYTRVMTVFFNLKNPLLKNKEVREAIANSIPDDVISRLGEEALGPIPPVSWAFNPQLKKTIYDLELAKKMVLGKFVEATKPAELKMSTYYEFYGLAEIIKDSLKEIGLKIRINFLDSNEKSGFDILFAYWKVPHDPDQYFFWHSTQDEGNITHYKNLKVDKLLEDGRNTLSLKERKKYYKKFQQVLVDDKPALFLYYPYLYEIKRK